MIGEMLLGKPMFAGRLFALIRYFSTSSVGAGPDLHR